MLTSSTGRFVETWNRMLHSYVGLYLLCFLWLFGISGEIERITARAGTQSRGIDIRVLRPGLITDIRADFGSSTATIEQIRTNMWGVIHWLHHFTGVRMNAPRCSATGS